MTERQRILGIDPGSRLTGFGVLDCASGSTTYVASGAVLTRDGAFPERLRFIFHSVKEIVDCARRFIANAINTIRYNVVFLLMLKGVLLFVVDLLVPIR